VLLEIFEGKPEVPSEVVRPLLDKVSLAVGDRHVEVRMVGVFRIQTQSDAELLVPMETANRLAENNDTVSLIEFSLKEGVSVPEALNQITLLIPENVRLYGTVAKLVKCHEVNTTDKDVNTSLREVLNLLSIR
jgi:hypothetical protein